MYKFGTVRKEADTWLFLQMEDGSGEMVHASQAKEAHFGDRVIVRVDYEVTRDPDGLRRIPTVILVNPPPRAEYRLRLSEARDSAEALLRSIYYGRGCAEAYIYPTEEFHGDTVPRTIPVRIKLRDYGGEWVELFSELRLIPLADKGVLSGTVIQPAQ